MRQTLEMSKSESRAKVIDALELMQTQAATLASERGQIGETEASLVRLQRDIDKSFAGFSAENAQKLADAERLMDQNVEKLRKARLKTADMTLLSPIDGTVSGSIITSVGQVLSTGEQVMQIVPLGREARDRVLPAERRHRLRTQGAGGDHQGRELPLHRLRHDRRQRWTAVAHDAIPRARRRPGTKSNPAHGRTRTLGMFGGGTARPEPRLPGVAVASTTRP